MGPCSDIQLTICFSLCRFEMWTVLALHQERVEVVVFVRRFETVNSCGTPSRQSWGLFDRYVDLRLCTLVALHQERVEVVVFVVYISDSEQLWHSIKRELGFVDSTCRLETVNRSGTPSRFSWCVYLVPAVLRCEQCPLVWQSEVCFNPFWLFVHDVSEWGVCLIPSGFCCCTIILFA